MVSINTIDIIVISPLVYVIIGIIYGLCIDSVFDYDKVENETGESKTFLVIVVFFISITLWPYHLFYHFYDALRKPHGFD